MHLWKIALTHLNGFCNCTWLIAWLCLASSKWRLCCISAIDQPYDCTLIEYLVHLDDTGIGPFEKKIGVYCNCFTHVGDFLRLFVIIRLLMKHWTWSYKGSFLNHITLFCVMDESNNSLFELFQTPFWEGLFHGYMPSSVVDYLQVN